jgi:hypothetical protein
MSQFIAQNEGAHGGDRLIVAVPLNHSVVARTHDLDDEEDEHFELHAKPLPHPVEQSEGELSW